MKDIMSIKKRLEQKSAINGKAGVAIMSDMLNDEKIRNLVIMNNPASVSMLSGLRKPQIRF